MPNGSGSNVSLDHAQAKAAKEQSRTARWALRASALFSIAALLVSGWSLVEQRSINADQKSVNEDQRRVIEDTIRANNETRAERRMEYASQVTWWLDGNDWLSVYIQNGSGVPISDVRLRYKAIRSEQDFDRRDDLPVHDGSPVVQVDIIEVFSPDIRAR